MLVDARTFNKSLERRMISDGGKSDREDGSEGPEVDENQDPNPCSGPSGSAFHTADKNGDGAQLGKKGVRMEFLAGICKSGQRI